jgi:membrane-bound lytic murein transglycosylase D
MRKSRATYAVARPSPGSPVSKIAARRRRDWRLGAIGASCTTLGIACLMLAACSATPTRPAPLIMRTESSAAQPQPLPATASVTPAPPEPAVSASTWDRMRKRFAMQGCDYNAAVKRWAHVYTQSPTGFAASLSESMPFLLVVLEQLEKRNVPAEFVFLPYIESNYTALASSGDRAAGIWQLMPDTAREAGLRVTPEYDGRLDVYASTTAALDLLERYQERFGDWRIADMAFNAGPYGIMQLVSDNRSDRTASELGRLRVHAGTHDHLAKLLAVACVISDPEKYHVELPQPDVDDQLALIELPAPVDLELAARLAAIDSARLHHLNPGFLRARMPANGPFHLLIPAARRQLVERTLGKLPQYAWREWHNVTLKRDETMNLFATQSDLDPSALASINNVAPDAPLTPGTKLLLPGRATTDSTIVDVAPEPRLPAVSNGTVTVRAGDTLWGIARLNNVSIDNLVHWNGLNRATTLHLGQRLRLSAPDSGSGGHSTAMAAPAAN